MLPDPGVETIVDRHFFDRVISITNDTTALSVAPGQYGPFPIWSPPANVSRSIIQRMAVVGIPSAYFRSRFYWALGISNGPVQEFIVDTLTGQFNTITQTAVVAGVQYAPHGYLDDLEPVNILVKQGAQLQISFFGGDPAVNADTPNAVVRLYGVNEFGKVGML